MSGFTMLVGRAALCIGALFVLAVSGLGTAYLLNKSVWRLLDSFGGIKVFNEYRQWLANRELKDRK